MAKSLTKILMNLIFSNKKTDVNTSNLDNGDVAFCSEDKSITLKYNDTLYNMCPPTAQASIPDASTSQKGIVQLTSSINSNSAALAATASAVKAAYDRGSTGITDAATAKSRADSAYTEATKTASSTQAGRVQLATTITNDSTKAAAASTVSSLNSTVSTLNSTVSSLNSTVSSLNSKVPSSGTILTSSNISSYALTSSNYTTETWTFTLSSGSTVSKTVMLKS